MLLRRYAFPGNITELRDLVERAAVQAGEAAPQLNADLFWFATQASHAGCLCALCVLMALLKRPPDVKFGYYMKSRQKKLAAARAKNLFSLQAWQLAGLLSMADVHASFFSATRVLVTSTATI